MMLNYVEVIEEPNGSEKILLRVITRTQAKDLNTQKQRNEENTKKPKRKTRRKAPNKASSPKNSQ